MPFIPIDVTEGGFTSSSPATSVGSASGTADDAGDRGPGPPRQGHPGPERRPVPSHELVTFPSEGATLRGRLYAHPEGTDVEPGRRPALVMAHGFTATISGMVAERYAERLHASGLQVLLFDHRGFGLSGGSPRRQVNRWVQARGYRDAITFLARRPDVDPGRIAIWGDSFSGGVAICVAAFDTRVRALVVQVPSCGAHDAAPSTGGDFEALRTVFDTAELASLPARVVGPAPVVSPDQGRRPSLLVPLTAYRWFVEFGGRPETGWSNEASVVELDTHPALHAQLCSPHLTCPSLWVVADDEMPRANPAVTLVAYGSAPGPKELLKIDGGHFGLLYPETVIFDRVVDAQARFLAAHLVQGGSVGPWARTTN